jgi:hypothetical protein
MSAIVSLMIIGGTQDSFIERAFGRILGSLGLTANLWTLSLVTLFGVTVLICFAGGGGVDANAYLCIPLRSRATTLI